MVSDNIIVEVCVYFLARFFWTRNLIFISFVVRFLSNYNYKIIAKVVKEKLKSLKSFES